MSVVGLAEIFSSNFSDWAQVLPSATQNRESLPHVASGGDAPVDRIRLVEAMMTGGSERAEAGQGSVQTIRRGNQTVPSVFPWMRGAEHRLAQVTIRPPPLRKP